MKIRTLVGLMLAGAIMFASGLPAASYLGAAEPDPTGLLPTPEPPAEPRAPFPRPRTPEEHATEQARYEEEMERQGGTIAASGPETAGATIELQDVTITLPDDAYIEMYTVSVICIEGHRCPVMPLHMIRQGNSRIEIDYSGNVIFEDIAPGDLFQFDWLMEDLR